MSLLGNFTQNHDKRILLGFAVSVLWLAAGAWFVFHVGDWSPDERFSLESVGSFLEGVFAPLAFLSLALTWGIGLLSWHFVEKPALKLKKRFSNPL